MSYARSTDLSASELSEHWRALLQKVKLQKNQSDQRVTLTSAHKSKGREWDTVIIPGLNGQYFPYHPEGEFTTAADIASERRLLYVSMTRARKELHLLAPDTPDKPLRECSDREMPSSFERELGVSRSRELFETIARGDSAYILRGQDGYQPQWLGHYLAHLGAGDLEVRFEASAPVGQVKRPGGVIDSKFNDDKKLPRIVHDTLGEGIVISEDSDYLKVRFDRDSRVRTLSRNAVMDKIRLL